MKEVFGLLLMVFFFAILTGIAETGGIREGIGKHAYEVDMHYQKRSMFDSNTQYHDTMFVYKQDTLIDKTIFIPTRGGVDSIIYSDIHNK